MGCETAVDVRRLKRRYSATSQKRSSMKKSIRSQVALENQFENITGRKPSALDTIGEKQAIDNEVFDMDVIKSTCQVCGSEDEEDFGSVSIKLEVQAKKSFRVSYNNSVWFIFLLVTVLCIVDRFTGTGDVVLNRSGKL